MALPCCEIVELFPARARDRRRFVALPFALARQWPAWQPGVRKITEDLIHPQRNPFWKRQRGSFFAALRGNRLVGRLAVLDPGGVPDRPHGAVLAFPDFVDDHTVTSALFDAAESRARERGAHEAIGPMNPDIHHDVGIQVTGHEHRNAAFMGFQPPYYAAHFERRGYERLADFAAWRLDREAFIEEGELHRLVRRVERRAELRIRHVDLRNFSRELELFHALYTAAFSGHWGFAPPSRDEFQFLAADLKHVLHESMALVAEWNGTPVGFVLGVPDFYSIIPKRSGGRITPGFLIEVLLRWRRIDEVRIMIAGVIPAYRQYGIHLPLFFRIAKEVFAHGFRRGEISWVLADNAPMAKVLPMLGARPIKIYRTFAKDLHH